MELMKRQIAAQRYSFPGEDIDFVVEELRALLAGGAFLTMGRHGEALEAAFARYCGTPHAVAVSSGTAALEIILRALDVREKEVVVPTNTFAATVFAVLHAGATPVFADCGPDLCVNPEDVAHRVTARTGAVITVHIGGLVSAGALELQRFCAAKGLPLVEDAAHAHGSALNGQRAGTLGVAAAFSFFSTKVMTTGEGGMIVTGDPAIHRQAMVLRDQAKVRGRNIHEVAGYNWRLTELQALLGLAQLRRLDSFIERRRQVAGWYDGALAVARGFSGVPVPTGGRHNFYKYILLASPGCDVGALETRMKREFGVSMGGRVYDLPCHEQPVFRPYARGALQAAEDLCRRHLCPPIYPDLTEEEARYVADALRLCQEAA